jgi:hypothetical protein
MRQGWLVVAALVLLWWGAFDAALALQCHGRVVSLGYSTWRVRQICGDPAHVVDSQMILPRRYYDPLRHIVVETFVTISKSVWTYNFGPTRLVYVLTFHDDKLVNIETEGYGR